MTQVVSQSLYKRDYTPGYAGHVPSKMERFGATAGQIKREILADQGKHPILLEALKEKNDELRFYSQNYTPQLDKNKQIYGNLSMFAKNWVCGPNHEIRNQRVPGYTGHVKGLISENLFSDTFGNTTTKTIARKHSVGHDLGPRERFLSHNTSQFKAKNFRRFIERPEMQPVKDYEDYSRFINDTYNDDKVDLLNQSVKLEGKRGSFAKKSQNPILSLRVQADISSPASAHITRRGFQTTKFGGPRRLSSVITGAVTDTEKLLGATFNEFDVKPRLLESKLAQRDDFRNLSNGFKQAFAMDKSDKKMILPIAGYGGHKRGDRSHNFFGKSFRECSIQSKKLQRHLRTPSRS
uniref:Uncharacterized protein n=1 Tax=Strombidium rassoulzadegani TaxID=1082188 RepID=A0A7S3CJQ4_9SPIT|mmetsp:Transcript_13445/g.22889  ORF Transcript_13445/g.22889 Transcript_13445/m.22889 type:complete len:351 (+) Transcript_13445:33-1085(+)